MRQSRALGKWFTPGIGVKRWLLLMLAGIAAVSIGTALGIVRLILSSPDTNAVQIGWATIALLEVAGILLISAAIVKLSQSILAPYRRDRRGAVIDAVYSHSRRHKGIHVVAIGGGTGLPSILRALKPYTSNLTAVVTVADDGGSSGRLRRELGVLPPGDLRNNIAALADDESLMTQLFQHRFQNGDLGGHAFGNLFISALSAVTGSLESALVETGRVLNIEGQVFPATLEEVDLVAQIRTSDGVRTVEGESRISETGGAIEQLGLTPANAQAFAGSVEAILNADLIVVGPGSLYTSILPNVLVEGIREALRATAATKIYVCNIAMQPGETDDYSVAEHVEALERYLGRGIFQRILANSHYPIENQGVTRYVQPAPRGHAVYQRYEVQYADLVDEERPWRHDSAKLAAALLRVPAPVSSTAPERIKQIAAF